MKLGSRGEMVLVVMMRLLVVGGDSVRCVVEGICEGVGMMRWMVKSAAEVLLLYIGKIDIDDTTKETSS